MKSLRQVASEMGEPYEEVRSAYISAMKKLATVTGLKGQKLMQAIRDAVREDMASRRLK